MSDPNKPLIIETDIGRDPDDFFALLYLISAGKTFNLGGDKAGSAALLARDGVVFVGKNLCHTLSYTRENGEYGTRKGPQRHFAAVDVDIPMLWDRVLKGY